MKQRMKLGLLVAGRRRPDRQLVFLHDPWRVHRLEKGTARERVVPRVPAAERPSPTPTGPQGRRRSTSPSSGGKEISPRCSSRLGRTSMPTPRGSSSTPSTSTKASTSVGAPPPGLGSRVFVPEGAEGGAGRGSFPEIGASRLSARDPTASLCLLGCVGEPWRTEL